MSGSFVKKEKGQSLVEMAISFTLLLVIIGGIIDLGMLFYTYLSLRDVAQEGAIYGSYVPTDQSGIYSRIKNSASWPIDSTQITNITVTCNGSNPCVVSTTDSCPGQKITVRVIYNYQPLLPMFSAITSGGPFSLNATVTDTILSSSNTINYFETHSGSGSCSLSPN